MAHSARLFFQIELRCVFFVLAAVSALSTSSLTAVHTVPLGGSIQDTIAAANPGDTVRVSSGTFTGTVSINKSLHLIGAGASSTTIEAPADFAANSAYDRPLSGFVTERPIVYAGSTFVISVLIDSLTIDGVRGGPSFAAGGSQVVAYSGILADRCSLTVRYNVIKNVLPADSSTSTWHSGKLYNGRGINVRGDSSVAVISNNTLEHINRFHIRVSATDDTLVSVPTVFPYATVTNNTIVGKGVYNGGQKGVWFNNGAWGTIQGNTISELDYTDPALEPDRSTGIIIWIGTLNPSHRSIIAFNNISSSTSINNKGIYVWGVRDTVSDNTVSGYRYGIESHESFSTAILRNVVTGGLMGILLGQETQVARVDTITIGGAPENKNTVTGQASGFEVIGGVEKPNGYAISLCFRDPLGDPFFSTVPVNAAYNDFGVSTFDSIGVRVFDRADTTMSPVLDTVVGTPFYTPKLRASVKVYLQGPYNTIVSADSMFKNMNVDPGGALQSHFTTVAIPSLAVDSINVELRNAESAASSTIRKFAPAWLMTDGTIRNFTDETKSYVEFDTTIAGSYYLVVRHRNHLAVMDSLPQNIDGSTSPAVYDFTTAQNKAYGTNPMVLMGTKYSMFAGDADANAGVGASDLVSVLGAVGLVVYTVNDMDMNGGVGASDLVLTQANVGQISQLP